MKIGDTVQYRAEWLRNVGIYMGDLPRAKGRVVKLTEYGKTTTIADVEWDLPGIPTRVNTANLHKVGTPEAV
jgi:hypothetical protein